MLRIKIVVISAITTIAIELKQLTVISYVNELEVTTIITATITIHVATLIFIDIVT